MGHSTGSNGFDDTEYGGDDGGGDDDSNCNDDRFQFNIAATSGVFSSLQQVQIVTMIMIMLVRVVGDDNGVDDGDID